MKYTLRIIAMLSIVAFLFSCEDVDLEDQGIILQDLPGYVAFNGDGAGIVLDTVEATESTGVVELNIENPTGTLSDITVSFEFSGTAVFGIDYTVPNSTAAGGTVILPNDQSDVNFFNNVDIEVTTLTDAVVDGEKILTVTLTNAVNEDGETFAVGRGGTDILLTSTIRIADDD